MKQLEKRGEEFARAQQKIAVDRIEARLREQLNAVQIEVAQFEIRIRGVGLVKRWLTETGLRFVAGLVK
jgi:hypothetical protein